MSWLSKEKIKHIGLVLVDHSIHDYLSIRLTKRIIHNYKKKEEYDEFEQGYSIIKGSKAFSGLDEDIGGNVYYNTSLSSRQLVATLASLAPDKVDSILEQEHDDELLFQRFIEQKILSGLKIMDLGCGFRPGYANSLFVMGADIYTSDHNSQNIKFLDASMIDKHVELDFTSEDAVDKLLERTGGSFDFVGGAIVCPVPFDFPRLNEPKIEQLENIAYNLLKKDCFFYNCNEFEIYRKI